MAASAASVGVVNHAPLSLNGSGSATSVPSSVFFGKKVVTSRAVTPKASSGSFKVVAVESIPDENLEKQTNKDRWAGLGYDISDDQQDITRGKGMVDSLFQAPMQSGTHYAVMSSYEYLSTGLKTYEGMDNILDGYYIAPAFMDKLVVHITKNYMTLPNIKVPLILGLWGGKGQGKSFQCELVFAKMGINPIMMSAGELESGNAGEPAKLIRQRYREAADIIKKGKMSCLFINDLDAGAGRLGGTTQYTVNNQMVNATLMNIADNPTNVQLPGMYNKEENPRVPIIVTGNDFSTLYAPLIRDGRMEKFYWAPTREDRIGVCKGIFRTDNVADEDIVKLVDTFPGQSIDFFGALRARVYDDEVRKWVVAVGVQAIGKKLVNSKEPPPKFEQPAMTLQKLLEYGSMLVQEQENVKRVKKNSHLCCRYVVSELATDITVIVGDVKFYLHKFPLLSKSAHLQKLVTGEHNDEIYIPEIPGGSAAFEICAKFCYGMTVTLNAYNVVAARCAAEYLGMHETIEKGNLTYKIDVFLSSSIFRSWKDSIIVLQSTKALMPLSEELKLVSNCLESIAVKASADISKVDWSYTYNRKKLPEENGNNPNWNGVRNRSVPKDWWVEDLCELEIDVYKRVIVSIKNKGIVPNDVIGEALKAYAYRYLPGFSKGVLQCGDPLKYQSAVSTIVWLLPAEKGSVSSSFLSKLLKASIFLAFGDETKDELVRQMGQQLEEASVSDLLIRSPEGEAMTYDVNAVQKMVEVFLLQDHNSEIESLEEGNEIQEPRGPGILSDATKLMVAKLIDGYLAEVAKDPNLPSVKFIDLAEMVSGIARPSHDGLYRAIDMYLKEHPGIGKSDKKRICKLIDCKKLSADACIHAVQNERLPLRMVVQVLFFEQVRASASSGCSTPDLPKAIKDLTSGSHSSSRSATTNPEEDWDAVAMAEELKALKGELASLRLANGRGSSERNGDGKNGIDKAALSKMKGLLKSKKLFTKLWSSKGGGYGENSGSDSSESLGSANQEEAKSTPSRNRRHSVS